MARRRSAGEPQPGRRQWKESDARSALSDWKKSGLGPYAFARSSGISVKRLLYWTKRLDPAEQVTFVAVTPPVRPDARIEIERCGVILRLREDIVGDDLTRIVDALARVEVPC